MLDAPVEWDSVRSRANRDRPMVGSCLSRSSGAFFRSSSSMSLSACADSLQTRAHPARPIRSNVSALGYTSRCAFIPPVKRARLMRPSSVSNAARAIRSIGVRMSYAGTNARKPGCRVASLLWLDCDDPFRTGPCPPARKMCGIVCGQASHGQCRGRNSGGMGHLPRDGRSRRACGSVILPWAGPPWQHVRSVACRCGRSPRPVRGRCGERPRGRCGGLPGAPSTRSGGRR